MIKVNRHGMRCPDTRGLRRRLLAGFLLSVACASTLAGTTIYQWQEADGTRVYSQLPPQDGRAVREVRPPPPPSTTPEQAQQELRQKQEDFRQRLEERQKATQEKTQQETAQAAQQQNCEAARANLERIQRQARILVDDGEGGRRRLSPEEQQQQVQRYRADVQKFCR